MSGPERSRKSLAQDELGKRNGRCLAISQRNASGTCACEVFELDEVKDGFPTCACGHTRWAHAKSWVSGSAAQAAA